MKMKKKYGMSLKSSRAVVAVFIFTVLLLVVGASPLSNDYASIPQQELKDEGNRFQIDCFVPKTKNYIISFVKTYKGHSYSITSDLFQHYVNRNTSIVYDKFKKTYEFQINSLTRTDIGLYSCELVELPEKPGECAKLTTLSQIDLKVLSPPEITGISISANAVHEGSTVTLECYATGYPEPIVFWKRSDNEKLRNTGVTKYPKNVLKIALALKEDSGVYECVAENPLGVAQNKSVKLTVFGKKQLTTEKYDVTEDIYEDEE